MRRTVIVLALSIFAVSASRSAELNLSWTDNSDDEKGFQIERRLVSESVEEYRVIATVGENVTVYSDGAAWPGVEYFYRVAAYNDSGPSGYTNEASGTAPVYEPVVEEPEPAPEPPDSPSPVLEITTFDDGTIDVSPARDGE